MWKYLKKKRGQHLFVVGSELEVMFISNPLHMKM